MKTIWKYEIEPLNYPVEITVPKNSKVLSFNIQNGRPYVWVLVDDEETETEIKTFEFIGTGHSMPNYNENIYKFIGTVLMEDGVYVFHLFEIIGE